MYNTKTQKNCILFIICIILFILYIVSFSKSCSSDSRKLLKSALVNSKYTSSINRFEIITENKVIQLFENNNIWFVSSQKDSLPVPADSNIIQNFISKLTEITEMYKITEKIDTSSSFGLLNESTIKLKYFYNDSDFSEIYFGDYDFSQTARYVMSGKNTTVYLVNNILDNYLTASLQFWADPLIISKSIFNFSTDSVQRLIIENSETRKILTPSQSDFSDKITSIIDLRHGGQAATPNLNNKTLSIQIENGDKKNIFLTFFKNSSDYTIRVEGFGLTYDYKISEWTYNKYNDTIL